MKKQIMPEWPSNWGCLWHHKREAFGKISILFSISSMGNYDLVFFFRTFLLLFSSSFSFFLVLSSVFFLREGGIVCNDHFFFFLKKQTKETRERENDINTGHITNFTQKLL